MGSKLNPVLCEAFSLVFHKLLSYLMYRYEYGKILNSLRSWRMPIHHDKKLVCGEHKHKICPAVLQPLPCGSVEIGNVVGYSTK